MAQEKEATIAHRHVAVSTVITAITAHVYNLAKECYRQDKPLYSNVADTLPEVARTAMPVVAQDLG